MMGDGQFVDGDLRPTGRPPRAYPFIGHVPEIARRGLLDVLVNLCGRSGRIVPLKLGLQVAHVATHPDHLMVIGAQRHKNFIKGTALDNLRLLLGNGLVTSDGDAWLRERRMAAPTFQRDKLAGLLELATGPLADALDAWDRGPDGVAFDFHHELKRVIFRISGLTLFGCDLADGADEATRAFAAALEEITRRNELVYSLPMAIPTPGNVRLRRAIGVLDRHVQGIIDRRADGGGSDVLSTFIRARRDRPGELSDRQLRDEIVTLYLAGHDATSHTLSWVFHFAALYPEIQARMREEAMGALGGRTPTPADLPRLSYTRQVVEESLRAMSPAAVLARQVVEHDELDGVKLPAGSWVILSPFITHHLPEFWPDPDRFDPDRFNKERAAGRHLFAFCPFGLGARTCIGNHLAMAEVVLMSAMLLERYRFVHVPGNRVTPVWRATLQPKGLRLRRERVRTAGQRCAATVVSA